MTERKPPEVTFGSWVDQQIDEAAKRGAFDNLPGAGKPLPNRGEAAGDAWLREYLRREGVSAEELLPTPLKLRKEIGRLADSVQGLRSEQEVREVVAGLNRRIIEWRKIPLGPPIFLPLVNTETMVGKWREGQPVAPPAPSPAHPGRREPDSQSPRPRWRRRLKRGR
jgi:hypothetical protein